MEYSIIQFEVTQFRKGNIIHVYPKEDVVNDPECVFPCGNAYDYVKQVARWQVVKKPKKILDQISSDYYPRRQHFYIVEQDFVYFEPTDYAGYGNPSYVSAVQWDMENCGKSRFLDEYFQILEQDFRPWLDAAEKKNQKEFSGLLKYGTTISVPTVWGFSSWYSYDGEYDCSSEYIGILNTSQLSKIILDTSPNTELAKLVEVV